MSGSYSEWEPAPALRDLVACVWERTVAPGTAAETRVLPDGCVDLVWRDDGLSFVAGPDTGPVLHHVPAGVTVSGLRLRPGAAVAGLGLPASELRDQRVPLDALWGRAVAEELGERLAASTGARGRLSALQDAVQARQPERVRPDRIVQAAVTRLGDSRTRLDALAAQLGVSDRELRRRFNRTVGYGPKRLDRILRFQRLLALTRGSAPRPPGAARAEQTEAWPTANAGTRRTPKDILGAQALPPRAPRPSLAALAAELGYADQAHLSRSVRELSGLTPTELLAAS